MSTRDDLVVLVVEVLEEQMSASAVVHVESAIAVVDEIRKRYKVTPKS